MAPFDKRTTFSPHFKNSKLQFPYTFLRNETKKMIFFTTKACASSSTAGYFSRFSALMNSSSFS